MARTNICTRHQHTHTHCCLQPLKTHQNKWELKGGERRGTSRRIYIINAGDVLHTHSLTLHLSVLHPPSNPAHSLSNSLSTPSLYITLCSSFSFTHFLRLSLHPPPVPVWTLAPSLSLLLRLNHSIFHTCEDGESCGPIQNLCCVMCAVATL